MKKAINAVIRTKLQEQEEQEIGVVTPVNPRDHPQENPLSQIQECYHQVRGEQLEEVSQP